VISLTQSMGLELIRHKINVNGIAPASWTRRCGTTSTRSSPSTRAGLPGEKKRLVGEAVPYGRMGRPDDMVGAAVFLASADADYIVAQTLNVDGGNWMS
jgi:D-sorbitol dehydrogenase (acceptor)